MAPAHGTGRCGGDGAAAVVDALDEGGNDHRPEAGYFGDRVAPDVAADGRDGHAESARVLLSLEGTADVVGLVDATVVALEVEVAVGGLDAVAGVKRSALQR